MSIPLGSTTAPRPQPVATAGAISAAVTVLAVIAGAFGIVLSDGQRDQLSTGILGLVGLVSLIGQIVAFLKARNAVTPTSDPVDARGVPLVPADSYDGLEVPAGGITLTYGQSSPGVTLSGGDIAAAYGASGLIEGGPDDLDDDDPDDDPPPAP